MGSGIDEATLTSRGRLHNEELEVAGLPRPVRIADGQPTDSAPGPRPPAPGLRPLGPF